MRAHRRTARRRGAPASMLFAGLLTALLGAACSTGGNQRAAAVTDPSVPDTRAYVPALPDPIPGTLEVLDTWDSVVPGTDMVGECVRLPPLGMGEYAADGSGSSNVLADRGIVRSDLRSNIGGGGAQRGTEVTLTLFVSDATCRPLVGAAVYLWSANAAGVFSRSDSATASSTWLRGVQISDQDGKVTFRTIVPGRTAAAAAHFNLAVYSDATFAKRLLATRLAIDDEQLEGIYGASDVYATSLATGLATVNDPTLARPAQYLELLVTNQPTAVTDENGELVDDTLPDSTGTAATATAGSAAPAGPRLEFAASLMIAVPTGQ